MICYSLALHSIKIIETNMLNLPLSALKVIGLHATDNSWIAQIKAVIASITVFITSVMESVVYLEYCFCRTGCGSTNGSGNTLVLLLIAKTAKCKLFERKIRFQKSLLF